VRRIPSRSRKCEKHISISIEGNKKGKYFQYSYLPLFHPCTHTHNDNLYLKTKNNKPKTFLYLFLP